MLNRYLITVLIIALSDCKIMRWVHDSKWSNPNNWNLNRVPCSKDTIAFPSPESTPTVIFLQQNISVTEMHLAFNGELIFFDDSGIGVTQPNTIDPLCAVGGEIRFNARERGWWLDERNWCEITRVEGVDCLDRPRFRLDTERVPCKSDEVVFTKFSSLLVQVESNLALSVGVLKMFNRYQNTPSFISLVKNSDVSDHFFWPTTTVINIAGQTCNEVSDCECGNNVGKVKEHICKRKTCPEKYPCTDWFTPEGHCCPVCGVLLTSPIDSSCFSARVFYYKIQDLLEQISVNHVNLVNVSVSKISSNRVQVAVIDISSKGEGIRIGHELKNLIEKVKDNKICLSSINFITSKSNFSSSTDSQTGERAQSRLGLGLSLFFIVVIVIIVCALAFNMRHRIRSQYIPTIRGRLSAMIPSRNTATAGTNTRSIVFDNSAIFDSSLSSVSDPTFFGFSRSEVASQMEMTEPRAKLVDHDVLSAARDANDGGNGMLQEAGRKIKATLGSFSPRLILSNLERRVSGESSDYFHKKMKEETGLEATEGEFSFDNPTFGRPSATQLHQLAQSNPQLSSSPSSLSNVERASKQKKSKLETGDSNLAFENPFFDEKKFKGKESS